MSLIRLAYMYPIGLYVNNLGTPVGHKNAMLPLYNCCII